LPTRQAAQRLLFLLSAIHSFKLIKIPLRFKHNCALKNASQNDAAIVYYFTLLLFILVKLKYEPFLTISFCFRFLGLKWSCRLHAWSLMIINFDLYFD